MTGAAPGRLFHLVDAACAGELGAALAGGGPWAPDSLERDGFVHLSLAEQVPATLARHFARAPRALLVEAELADAGALRLEEPGAPGPAGPAHRPGERFPHLYRALETSELVRGWHLVCTPTGWRTPRLARDARDDDPPGQLILSLLAGR